MIQGSNRLIIILGMAHSGTTALTYLLQQHPDVVCCTDGTEAWLLENTWLPLEQADPIQKALNSYTGKRIMLKRPLNEVYHGEWMKQEMPNAKFVYCYRPFSDMAISWSKSGSVVEPELRNGGLDHQKQFYDMCFQKAGEFGKTVASYWPHSHQVFESYPKSTIQELAQWLGLKAFEFDTSFIGHGKNIKSILGKRR